MIALSARDDRNAGLDGLRALAVGAVLAFHAGERWARGGYLGVDAFFVLSGFLITTLLLEERARNGRISVRDFWARRLARLIPALALLVTVVVSIQVVRHADGLAALRGDAVATLSYVANWRYLIGNHGYFGRTSAPSLLQHTWSLSIEEQFYLLWPLVVLLLSRSRRPRIVVGTVAALGAAASALTTVLLAHGGASNSRLYFGTDTRIQAILIGAALGAWIGGRSFRASVLHPIALVGLATTVVLWWRLDGASPLLFRGGTTLIALATAAIIPSVALVPNGVVGRVLGVTPLRALGVISYGIYLWHWPVQMLVTHAATGWEGPPLLLLRAVLTVAAATASYWLVEAPLRAFPTRASHRIVSFSSMIAVTVAICLVLTTVELRRATPVLAAQPAVQVQPVATTVPVTSTAPPATARPVVARPRPAPVPTTAFVAPTPNYRTEVLGDSVAQSVAQGFVPVAPRYGLTILDDGVLGCGVAPAGVYRLRGEEHDIGSDCFAWESIWTARVQAAHANVALVQVGRHEVLDTRIENVWQSILGARLGEAVAAGLDRAIEIAGSTGARVVLLTAPYYATGEAPDGKPWPENDPARVNRFNQLVRDAAVRHPGTRVVDLGAYTNPGGHYASRVAGIAMRKDGVHYSAAACVWFARWLAPQIRDAAATPR
jgi:peptidoglycan/LPS O-acetylase OafA/YrhL